MGYGRLEIEDWQWAMGDWRLAMGDWQWAIGNGRLAIGDWRWAIGDGIWEGKMDEMWIKFAYIQKKHYFCNDLQNYLATIYKTTFATAYE